MYFDTPIRKYRRPAHFLLSCSTQLMSMFPKKVNGVFVQVDYFNWAFRLDAQRAMLNTPQVAFMVPTFLISVVMTLIF